MENQRPALARRPADWLVGLGKPRRKPIPRPSSLVPCRRPLRRLRGLLLPRPVFAKQGRVPGPFLGWNHRPVPARPGRRLGTALRRFGRDPPLLLRQYLSHPEGTSATGYYKRLNSTRIFSTLFYPNTLAGALLLLLPPVLSGGRCGQAPDRCGPGLPGRCHRSRRLGVPLVVRLQGRLAAGAGSWPRGPVPPSA